MSGKSKVRHIVMFDFSKLDEEKTNGLVKGFEALSSIPEILRFEWGIENNKEDSSLDFTHSFMLTFENFDTRTDYLNSKEHREYEQEVMKYRSKVLVFDYLITSIK